MTSSHRVCRPRSALYLEPLEPRVMLDSVPPLKPTLVSPSDWATGVSLTPVLQASAFSDPDPRDAHQGSQWQLGDYGSFVTPVWNHIDTDSDKTGAAVPPGVLDYSDTYYWRVPYQDSHGEWSAWSVGWAFTTAAAGTGRRPWHSGANGRKRVS